LRQVGCRVCSAGITASAVNTLDELREERPGETRPRVAIHFLRDDADSLDDAFRAQLAALVTDHLRRANRDYREAFGEYPALLPVVVDLHGRGEGPFAGTESHTKFKYAAR
jgi:hypothetical protein